MLQANGFFKVLIGSGWVGAVSEAGLGVPFQDGLMRYPEGGASQVLKIGKCPYSREFQPGRVQDRAVSKAMAVAQAEDGLEELRKNCGYGGKKFSVAVTGAYKGPKEHGETHGWIALATDEGAHLNRHVTASHFWIPKGQLRSDAIDAAGKATCVALRSLLGLYLVDTTSALPAVFDVMEGFDLKELLTLCRPDNPLVFVPGTGLVRARDWIRRPGLRVFRGSFNPPHRVHEEMGRGALWAIDFENARKETIALEDMAHRVSMASLLGVPVLVTRGLPRFVDFHQALAGWGAEGQVRYVVGPDTLEAIIDPRYCNGVPEIYLKPLMHGRAVFEVFAMAGSDGGGKVVMTAKNFGLYVDPQESGKDAEHVRSSLVRAGKRADLHPDVAAYVEDQGLYAKKKK